ncbi:Uu.00g011420.m01.CDS01 [Anthostomella pinea]|uniref:Uu.00g011420.m01.CDS01 n=1 Tax=Anthostomella pinea TaxID=933095 RepID=A0AAI8YQ30_9PEZI|nr:Uu.00g011420.m01.CDS01 [Anthostomella pinea]
MCGIHAAITTTIPASLPPHLRQSLANRGPDHFGQIHREIPSDKATLPIHLLFTSTVLALRGDHIAKQPLESSPDESSVLCWNGEAWRFNGESIDGNDGETIISKLQASQASSPEVRETHVLEILRSIEGPFAFIYFDSTSSRLYYGRDRLGRRSLLLKRSSDGDSISLSSIADVPTAGWEEVEAVGIYALHLGDPEDSSDGLCSESRIAKYDWLPSGRAEMVSSIGEFNMSLPPQNHRLDFDSASLGILKHWLVESLRLRVLNVPEPPNPASDVDIRIAVLFSGGIDCTILARLAHDLLPPNQGIDLINVAFENPRQVSLEKRQPHLRAADIYEGCPDRATGRKAFAELKATCLGRYWRFIAVNVPFQDAMAHKTKVMSLIHPHDTEMDLSIAFALYFAARGMGDGYTENPDWQPSPPVVTTPARVLLSGLGADELFGGYSRHEAAFKRGGYPSLIDELKLDVSRIGQRNLGRDDRIMAHWGKEVRFPYLDEEFVRFAIGSPVWEKCDFQNQFHPAVIDPAKRILRLMADQLSLPIAARQKKKAIQFGSRTAKMESTTGRIRGTAPVTMNGSSDT